MKKIFSTLLSAIVLVSCTVPSYAAVIPEDIVVPLYDNISLISNVINFDGIDGEATAKVTGKSGTTSISATLTVYRQTTSGGWSYVGSDSDTVSTRTLNLSVDFSGISGEYYKAVVETVVTIDGIDESGTKTVYKTCP